jgi:hypothetical protein
MHRLPPRADRTPYVEAFAFRDRLGDLVAYGLVAERLTEDEAELIELAVAGDVAAAYDAGWRQGRMALALLWPRLSASEALQRAEALTPDRGRAGKVYARERSPDGDRAPSWSRQSRERHRDRPR